MVRNIKLKVLEWIHLQLKNGKVEFDVFECTKKIGLDPFETSNIERVDEIIQWNAKQLNKYLFFEFNENT